MTHAGLLQPLRIPELGPYLGKLVNGTGRMPAGLYLDPIRQRLVTRLFETAGEARRLAARDERAAALATLGPRAWLEAWEEAVGGVAELLADRIHARLQAEARAVRMPPRRRRRLTIDGAERRALAARLGAAAAPLVSALDTLKRSAGAFRAAADDPGKLEPWQAALTGAAQRLEGAWLTLEDAVDREAERWESVADRVARWRKSLWPVVVTGALLVGGAAWLGLVMGGYLDAPAWLSRSWQAVLGG